ncbi:hypothetical protein RRG08_011969 [Elysia crispata]|uniref:Uncharacterized protein n=1 Tax=Elysia crispata TaxID=231223 RepID=A0AAE0ZI18_9GAST|nr:hypothetical protein RRG08_011969 [Elysia crispata]
MSRRKVFMLKSAWANPMFKQELGQYRAATNRWISCQALHLLPLQQKLTDESQPQTCRMEVAAILSSLTLPKPLTIFSEDRNLHAPIRD